MLLQIPREAVRWIPQNPCELYVVKIWEGMV